MLEVNTRGNGNSFISTSGINPNSIYLMMSRNVSERSLSAGTAQHNIISSNNNAVSSSQEILSAVTHNGELNEFELMEL